VICFVKFNLMFHICEQSRPVAINFRNVWQGSEGHKRGHNTSLNAKCFAFMKHRREVIHWQKQGDGLCSCLSTSCNNANPRELSNLDPMAWQSQTSFFNDIFPSCLQSDNCLKVTFNVSTQTCIRQNDQLIVLTQFVMSQNVMRMPCFKHNLLKSNW